MKRKNTIRETIPKANFFIDITDQVCPLTFVKTKLLLESMPANEVAEIRLQGGEALENVPRSVKEHGHLVLALYPEKSDYTQNQVHRLILRKV